ncbi:UNVERIFIED_CONTAM: hypothetical protein Sradi_2095100 [Sesamum radiatum]|uniref:Reverse transcriptase/retrotransposon-derived protein RNase H-like domain-containing protein n=1 Tax=Sesamum radiatum TaxID=300843 RepID=A0AAW2TJ28_SESRA
MGPPTSINEVQRLMGKIAALSRFISKSAEKGLPFFRMLRKVKDFEWTKECQRAFKDLKAYLAKLPLLDQYQKIPCTFTYHRRPKLLARCWEDDPGLSDNRKKLCPYFLSYLVDVRTNTSLKQVLGKPEASGRLVKWAIELSEYDMTYLSRTTIKAQALADFMSEVTGTTQEEASEGKPWLLYIDGSSTTQGSGASIVLTTPQRDDMEFAGSNSKPQTTKPNMKPWS